MSFFAGRRLKTGVRPGVDMEVSDLFERFEIEFEIEIPEAAESALITVRDVRDYIRQVYREQGVEAPAGAIFERVRRLMAVLTRNDASEIEPATRLADLVPKRLF